MISAQNHQQLLSGNKLYIILLMVLFSACSPKIKPTVNVKPAPKKTESPVSERKFTEANIALLIPFKLNELNLKIANKASIERSAMAIDFYQGFKLGIDSAASSGLNFKIHVYDSQDDDAEIGTLFKNENFKHSNLVVGPIFPQGLKYIATFSRQNKLPIVSPLAASDPVEFNNPNLISVVNNINLHAQKISDFISRNYDAQKSIVVIINPKKAADEQFAESLKPYFNQAKQQFVTQEYTSVAAMETKMIKNRQYIVIVTSSDKSFVTPTIDKLVKLKRLKTGGYPIDLFGHPFWIKQNYNTDKLQLLNTVITTSYRVNYQDNRVINFVKKYRSAFSFEPSEYSFKGFDIGIYFGKLLSKYGEDYLKYVTREFYHGLHNDFSFVYNPQLGYINTNLMLLRYKNYALQLEK